jgi:hypothetical protein
VLIVLAVGGLSQCGGDTSGPTTATATRSTLTADLAQAKAEGEAARVQAAEHKRAQEIAAAEKEAKDHASDKELCRVVDPILAQARQLGIVKAERASKPSQAEPVGAIVVDTDHEAMQRLNWETKRAIVQALACQHNRHLVVYAGPGAHTAMEVGI